MLKSLVWKVRSFSSVTVPLLTLLIFQKVGDGNQYYFFRASIKYNSYRKPRSLRSKCSVAPFTDAILTSPWSCCGSGDRGHPSAFIGSLAVKRSVKTAMGVSVMLSVLPGQYLPSSSEV